MDLYIKQLDNLVKKTQVEPFKVNINMILKTVFKAISKVFKIAEDHKAHHESMGGGS